MTAIRIPRTTRSRKSKSRDADDQKPGGPQTRCASPRRACAGPPKTLTQAQQEALSAIVFFRRQRKVTRGWVIGDKRLSEKLVRGLLQMDLVLENVIDGRPVLQLTPAGKAARAQLAQ